ncbi:MAG: TIGR02147 family protein [Fibrobacterales bacterium]
MNIFGYYNYRTYLQDYYEYKKSVNRHFSYRKFAEKAGLKSASVFRDIMTGRRNLTPALVPKFAAGMNLEGNEIEYLKLMINFFHAQTPQSKQEIFEKMAKMLPKSTQKLNSDQRKYFDHWYHIAIREALAVLDIDDNYQDLAFFLTPKISIPKVKQAIELLDSLGLIEKQGQYWRSKNASIQGDHIDAFTIHQLQKQLIDLSKESLTHFTKEKRNVSNATVSVSQMGMERISARIDACRQDIVDIVRSDSEVNQVYQFNVQFFPLSKERDNE